MRMPRRTRSTKAAVVAGLGIAAVISSALPASAATLAITSLDCQARHGGFLCTGYVSGGTSPYTYLWNQGALKTSSSTSTSSTAVVGCPAGSTTVRTISFTVTDSDGATASQSTRIDCSETW
jgi:hypothetical protein